MRKLSVEEILEVIAALPDDQRERFEREYEKRAWEECLKNPDVIDMLKDRYVEVKEALKRDDVKTLEHLRAEFEAQGLL